jgi:predicted nicotinamide N-methyase
MASGTSSRSTPPRPERGGAGAPAPAVRAPGRRPAEAGQVAGAPDPAALAALLDREAPLQPAPLCPEVQVFQGRELIAVWEAAERLAGGPLPAPFWAYPWPGGAALARVVLDAPERVRDRRVLDLGTGGGLAALAAARAGAAEVVANDIDPWALATARLAAARQRLELTTLHADLTAQDAAGGELDAYDVVLCADLYYERRTAPRLRALLERARRAGAEVLVADAGRAYFDPAGLVLLAEYDVAVPADVEGVERRLARVYRLA